MASNPHATTNFAARLSSTSFRVATRTVVNEDIALPGCSVPAGISIDIDGLVWSPDYGTHTAYKLDPDTHQILQVVGGLATPYTYSDMTGAGLGLVTNPPQG